MRIALLSLLLAGLASCGASGPRLDGPIVSAPLSCPPEEIRDTVVEELEHRFHDSKNNSTTAHIEGFPKQWYDDSGAKTDSRIGTIAVTLSVMLASEPGEKWSVTIQEDVFVRMGKEQKRVGPGEPGRPYWVDERLIEARDASAKRLQHCGNWFANEAGEPGAAQPTGTNSSQP